MADLGSTKVYGDLQVTGDITGDITGTVTGNATTATKLQTARTIGGVSFDGTANINLPGVNAAGNQSTSGNAATATKLATARTIALTGGVTGSATFDGSANVTITASVADDSHSHVISNVYGLQDALDGKLGSTATAVAATKLATARTIGGVSFDGTANINLPGVNTAGNQNTTGNAATATKLATARTINGVAFDGSADITINGVDSTAGIAASEKGVANGVATLDGSGKVPAVQLPSYVDDVLEFADQASFPVAGESGKIYIAVDTGKIYRWTGSVYVNISANASTADAATKLDTARSISITGDATWTTSFDGSANVTSALTLANSGVTAGTYPKVTVDAKGRVTAGAALSAADIPSLDASKITSGTFAAARIPTLNQNTTGNAATATKLQTARSIALTGGVTGSATFDGSANVTITASVADDSHSHVISNVYGLQDALDAKAPINSPSFGGTVTVPLLRTGHVASQSLTGISPFVAGNKVSRTYRKILTLPSQTSSNMAHVSIQGLIGGFEFSQGKALVTVTLSTRTGDKFLGSVMGSLGNADIEVYKEDDGTYSVYASTASWTSPWTISVIGDISGGATGASYVMGSTAEFSGVPTGTKLWALSTDGQFRLDHDGNVTLGSVSGNGSGLTTLNASNLASGTIPDARLSGTYTGVNITGNAATATQLATARTINGVSFDGSANIVIGADWANITNKPTTYAPSAHTHAISEVTGLQSALDGKLGSTATAAAATKLATARTIGGVSFDGTANINLPGVNTAGNQSTTGNAATATKLATSRTISATGDATWTTSFDGSADVTGALTLANSGVTAGTYPKVTVDAKGRVTAGAALAAADIPDLDAAKITSGTFAAARIPTLNQNTTGSAATLTTARTISITGDATWTTSFDGSANATGTLTLANSGVTAGTYPKVTVDAKGRVTAGTSMVEADVPSLSIAKTTGLQAALDGKVDKVAGQSLMLDAERTKLSGIEAGAQVNTVTSVAGKTGAVTLAKGDVGLSNVDNTSDINKPVSTATQTALNLKANLASPAFTGTPTVPTQPDGDNSTKVASTAFVKTALDSQTHAVATPSTDGFMSAADKAKLDYLSAASGISEDDAIVLALIFG